jgi:hypothetical protein
MPAGRPLKYNIQEVEKKIEDYFNSCWADVPVIGNFGPVMVDDKEQNPQIKINKKTGEEQLVYPKKILTEYKQIKPYTVTGLANSLNMTRQMLMEYQNKDKFGDSITRAKSKCEQYAEEQLFLAKNANGPSFNLKNNYNWRDKQDLEISGELNIANKLKTARERADKAE